MNIESAQVGHGSLSRPVGMPTRPAEAGRDELETFVRAAFARQHGAEVRTFMPELLGFRNPLGQLTGVVGMRSAAAESLYLEHYLDEPIEAALARIAGHPVDRGQIVEIGNLAGGNCRAAMRIVSVLPDYLIARGFNWIVFTATDAVQRILARIEAPLVEIAHADADRVATAADRWGTYYRTNPRVFAGCLANAHKVKGLHHG